MRTDFPLDSVLTEITFWRNREQSLQHIQEQLESTEILTVFDLLKKDSTMNNVVFSFQQNINVVHEHKKAQEFNLILKDCPINSLISSKDLKDSQKAIVDIFNHFKIFKNQSSYPMKRFKNLLEAFSNDASQRILKILEDVDLMTIESKQFDVIKEECLNILNLFDNTLRTFKDSLRNKHIHKTDRRAFENELDLVHSNVHARINEIVDQRRENEKLLEIVSSVFSQDEGESRNREAIKDIKEAYTVFLSINVLDMSIEGEKRWNKAKKEYNLKIDRVEEEITNEMRDKLASAKTTNDMFRTFSKFNALFSRPRIRGAIQEYQNQILSSIKKDVKNFRDRVLVKYNSSEVYKINKSMNFPTLSGLLMWYIQLERKLGQYLERIQSVLGAGWEKHVAGQQLKQPIDQISKVLTDLKNNEFKEWEERISKINNIGQSKIFKIVTRGDGSLKMEVNLNERALSIVKEKNILKCLGFKLSYAFIMKTGDITLYYPRYTSLVDSLAIYTQVNSIITEEIETLLASKRKRIHSNFKSAENLTWKDERTLDTYCHTLSVQIQELEEAAHFALEKNEKKNVILSSFTN
jgi:dynein heavy chain 1, cytosolic